MSLTPSIPPRPRTSFDIRAEVLRKVIQPDGNGIECGVFKGEFSRALIEHLAPLVLVDEPTIQWAVQLP